MPHYKEFADALIEYQYTINFYEDDKFRFSMGDTILPKEILDMLQEALKQTHFHECFFYQNHLDGVGYMNFITTCVTSNFRLKRLNLTNIIFEQFNDINILCEAVNNHESLEVVNITDCRSDQSDLSEIFSMLKGKMLKYFGLVNNDISNLRPIDMSDFIASNPSLQTLDLRYNPLNQRDMIYIAESLRNNTTLRELKLWSNTTLPDNWRILEPVVFDQTSLNTAYDSNHFCYIDINIAELPAPSAIYRFNTCNDPALNRRKKIYTILSTRNGQRKNAAYFESDHISIKHIPQILALVKPFTEHYLNDRGGALGEDEVEPLSILYEIMRDWKMPELYNLPNLRLDQMDED